MSSVFKITSRRKVYIANQNFFHIPTVHPSRTVDNHIISYVIKGGWQLKIGDEVINAKNDSVLIQPANVPRFGLGLYFLLYKFSVLYHCNSVKAYRC